MFDREIANLATRQQTQIARWQLHELGLDNKAIARRVSRGVLFRSLPGVFSVGHPPTTTLAWAFAAVLACGPDAVLSHDSAAALWEMGPRLGRPFHVTARSDRRISGVIVHRSKLTRREITRQQGIPVTTPARTALDIATTWTPKELARAVNNAMHQGYLHEAGLNGLVDRSAGRRGVRKLRPLATRAKAQQPTRSEFEDAFLAFTEVYGLPTPQTNVKIAGHVVDAYFPDHRLIVELDGYEFHKDRATFESDRDRDANHAAMGLSTLRITWHRLTSDSDREAERFQMILDRRAPLTRPGQRRPRT